MHQPFEHHVKVAVVFDDEAELIAVKKALRAFDPRSKVVAVEGDPDSSVPLIDQALHKVPDADIWMAAPLSIMEGGQGAPTKQVTAIAFTSREKTCAVKATYPADRPFPVEKKAEMMSDIIRNIMQNREYYLNSQRGGWRGF
jgi:hypothetical protein